MAADHDPSVAEAFVDDYMVSEFLSTAADRVLPQHNDPKHYAAALSIILTGALLSLLLSKFSLGDLLAWAAAVFGMTLCLSGIDGKLGPWVGPKADIGTPARRWFDAVLSCWRSSRANTATAQRPAVLPDMLGICASTGRCLGRAYREGKSVSHDGRAQTRLLASVVILILILAFVARGEWRVLVGVMALILLLSLPSLCRKLPVLLEAFGRE